MIRNRTIRFAMGAAALCAIGSCAAMPSAVTPDPADWPPSQADEAIYDARFAAMIEAFRSGAATTVYDTLATVRGAPQGALTEFPDVDGFPSGAANQIKEFAATNNSQALIVYQDGEILLEEYFDGANADALIVGKSLAKPLGVLAVGTAIAAGKIQGLDQPAADFFTEWRGTEKEAILIRHLLDMRSGLLPQAQAPEPENILNRAYLHPRHDEIIIREYPLTHEPGSRYEYSNANSELIAPLIERATGIQYEDWIADTLLVPLGAAGGEVWMNRSGGTAHAGCCILLPARTWLKLSALVLQDGDWQGRQILPDGFTGQMRTPTAQNSHSGAGLYLGQPYLEYRGFMNPEISFGRSFHSEPYVDEDLYLFDGNSNQVIYMIPSKDLIVLRVGNNPPRDVVWDNAFLPNLVSRALDAAAD